MIDINLLSYNRDDFSEPDAFFSVGYLWFWNDKLSYEKLEQQLIDMRSDNAKNVWVIPVPSDFRPLSMKTSMSPAYLSDEYMDIYKKMTDRIKSLGMRLWLYDEAGWPSGSVCGRITKENPALARQTIVKKEVLLSKDEEYIIPTDCLSAFTYKDNTPMRIKNGTLITCNDDYLKLEVYSVEKEQVNRYMPIYPDILNPVTTDTFLSLTHDRYYEKLSEHFGSTISVLVSDEPSSCNTPWTAGLDKIFYDRTGYSLLDNLPYIFNGGGNDTVNIDYYNVWSEILIESFFKKQHHWCEQHGVLYACHLGGEDVTKGSRIYGYGHILRALRCFDIPGVDTIWRQIFPGKEAFIEVDYDAGVQSYPVCGNHHFPKFASSVAHQKGTPWSWTESFSAYGSALTLEEMKWITNFQYVRGINLLISCQRHLSTDGHYMASMRPMLTPENPMQQYMRIFNDYTKRLSYCLSLGKPDVQNALYLPINDIWAGWDTSDTAASSYDKLAEELLKKQCDFDVLDDDVLSLAKIDRVNKTLIIGAMEYKHIYIPNAQYIPKETKRKLQEFSDCGGSVLYSDTQAFYPTAVIKPANENIRVLKRKVSDDSIYFLTNEGMSSEECSVIFKEKKIPYILNPETAEMYKQKYTVLENGLCKINVLLPFAGSLLLLFSDTPFECSYKSDRDQYDSRLLDKDWEVRILKRFKIKEERFTYEDEHDSKYITASLGDLGEVFGYNFSGMAEYRYTFNLDRKTAENTYELDLGCVKGAAMVLVNCAVIGEKAWSPYVFNTENRFKEGENTVVVRFCNTMANEYVHTDKLKKWPDTITGSYHKQCLAMEKDRLTSGIIGPVRIFIDQEDTL